MIEKDSGKKLIASFLLNTTTEFKKWISWGIVTEQITDEDGNKTDTDNRFLLNIKCNIGRKPKGFKFSIGDGGCVSFHTERVDMNMDNPEGQALSSLRVDEAAEWLEQRLYKVDANATAIFEEGEKAGFSKSLLDRAKDKLGINPIKSSFDGPWFWRLPNE